MTIRRGHLPSEHFTVISNTWVRDPRLSWKARGLLSYLCSHAISWETSLDRLVADGLDGRDSVQSGLAELRELGYLVVHRVRDEAGHLRGSDYLLVDPFSPSTTGDAVSPPSGVPAVGNPPPKKSISKKTTSPTERARSHEVPEDWQPDDAGMAYAAAKALKGRVLRDEIAAFVIFHRSKGNRFKRVDLAWQTWCRRWLERNPKPTTSSVPSAWR